MEKELEMLVVGPHGGGWKRTRTWCANSDADDGLGRVLSLTSRARTTRRLRRRISRRCGGEVREEQGAAARKLESSSHKWIKRRGDLHLAEAASRRAAINTASKRLVVLTLSQREGPGRLIRSGSSSCLASRRARRRRSPPSSENSAAGRRSVPALYLFELARRVLDVAPPPPRPHRERLRLLLHLFARNYFRGKARPPRCAAQSSSADLHMAKGRIPPALLLDCLAFVPAAPRR